MTNEKMQSMTGMKVTRFDRVIIWCIRKIPRINLIVQAGIGEAFDEGIKVGFTRGAKINGKTSQRKATKALKELYRVPKAKA